MAYQCLNKNRRIYYRAESAKAIMNVETLILDFDGVLVDISQSYNQAIIRVVDYYFLDILGLEGEKGKLITEKDVQDFRDTGLYNNDWSLAYAAINYYLTRIIGGLRRDALKEFLEQFGNVQFANIQDFLPLLNRVGDFLRSHGTNLSELVNTKNKADLGLNAFLAEAKKSQNPIDVPFMPRIQDRTQGVVKRLIPYDVQEDDFLRRLFEEAYLGKKFFNKFWNTPPVFGFKESLLEKESFIPAMETLDFLQSRFGKLLIYSEKPRVQGVCLLEDKNLKRYFEDRFVFQDEIFEAEKNDRGNVSYTKPNPAYFIKTIKPFKNKMIAYIGDTAADALMINNAKSEGLSNILFFGVLCSTSSPDELLSEFTMHGADVIMTDINDIPYIINRIEGKI